MQFWADNISAEEGPYKVLMKRGEFVDEARQNEDGSVRAVPYKIYYPSGDDLGTCPVILWSHGYGGSRDGAGFLSRYLASYGYVIIHLTHRGTDSSLWEGKPGHPWEVLKNMHISRATTLNRYRDIPFVLGQLLALSAEHEELGAVMDLDRVGMSGHSFGAISTQVAAGQLTPDENGELISLRGEGLKAGITYSPVPGTSHLSDGQGEDEAANIYESIAIPLLHMTGTEDNSPINDMPYTGRKKVYDRTGDGVPKAWLVKDGGDHMVYNGTRGQLKDNPKRGRHEEIIKIVSLAWWDYWLKGDEAAHSWMQAHLDDWMAEAGDFEGMISH
jgi:hypothetical protein